MLPGQLMGKIFNGKPIKSGFIDCLYKNCLQQI